MYRKRPVRSRQRPDLDLSGAGVSRELKRGLLHLEGLQIERASRPDARDRHGVEFERFSRRDLLRCAHRPHEPCVTVAFRENPADAIRVDAQCGAFIDAEPRYRRVPFLTRQPRDEHHQAPLSLALGEVAVRNDIPQKRQMQEVAHQGNAGPHRVIESLRRCEAVAIERAVAVTTENREAGARTSERLAAANVRIERLV